jgi:hypothetical protein
MPKLNYSRKSPALIDLDGPDGNAFAVVGLAAERMRFDGEPEVVVLEMVNSALAAQSYEHLLATVALFADVEFVRDGHLYDLRGKAARVASGELKSPRRIARGGRAGG